MILHYVSKPLSYYDPKQFIVAEEDTVLLAQDACYDHAGFSELFGTCVVLELDAKARNIESNTLTTISDQQWLELVLQANSNISW